MPERGKCVTRFEANDVQTAVIKYPTRLDRPGAELISENIWHRLLFGIDLAKYHTKVLRKLRSLDLDLLYCNNVRSMFLFGPPAKLLGLPVVLYVRGGTPNPLFDEAACRLADKVVTISDGVREKFEETYIDTSKEKFKTIYTGIDLEKFDPEATYDPRFGIGSDKQITIVQVAKIHPRKRQTDLIKAMNRIDNEVPEYDLVFAGSVAEGVSNYEKRLHSIVSDCGLESRVKFLGWVDDIPALLSKADIFVLPSSHEGFPRSILEANAMGVPAVATSAGGTAELIVDGKTGFVVAIGDVDALAERIRTLCVDTTLREAFGTAAKNRIIENFDEESYVREFEEFVEGNLNTQTTLLGYELPTL
jgi:glycosyltransferase involved in cell wall biosynthesis